VRSRCTAAGEKVSFVFIEDGEEVPVTAPVGKTLLEVAHDNEVDLEGEWRRAPPLAA
jgi:ferredoxin